MFDKVHCFKAIFLLLFCRTISTQFINSAVLESNGCENIQPFLNRLTQLPPIFAFKLLISPLQYSSPEILSVHGQLLHFARSGLLNIRRILGAFRRATYNRNDLLLKTLLLLNTEASLPPSVKSQTSRLIFYLLKKRYLQVDDYANAQVGFTSSDNSFGQGRSDLSIGLHSILSEANCLNAFQRVIGLISSNCQINKPIDTTPSFGPQQNTNVGSENYQFGSDTSGVENYQQASDTSLGLPQFDNVPSVAPYQYGSNTPSAVDYQGDMTSSFMPQQYGNIPSVENYQYGSDTTANVEQYQQPMDRTPSWGIPQFENVAPLRNYQYQSNTVPTVEQYQPESVPSSFGNYQYQGDTAASMENYQQANDITSLGTQQFTNVAPLRPYQYGRNMATAENYQHANDFGTSLGTQQYGNAPSLVNYQYGSDSGNNYQQAFDTTALRTQQFTNVAPLRPYQYGRNMAAETQYQQASDFRASSGMQQFGNAPSMVNYPIRPAVQTNTFNYQNDRADQFKKAASCSADRQQPTNFPKPISYQPSQPQLNNYPKPQPIVPNVPKVIPYTPQLQPVQTNFQPQATQPSSVQSQSTQSFSAQANSVQTSSLLLKGLPTPANDVEKGYYNLIKNNMVQLGPTTDVQGTTTQKLVTTFENMLQSSSLGQNVLEAVRFYLPVIRGQTSVNLIKTLPTLQLVKTEDEQQYNMLTSFLRSNQFYTLAATLKLESLTQEEQIWQILAYIINNNYNNLQQVARWYRNLLITQKFGFNFFELLSLIQVTPDMQPNLKVINDYFYSLEFQQILKKLNVTTLANVNKLMTILQAVVTSSTNSTVVQSATFLLQKLQIVAFYSNMDTIISLIPSPQNPNEQQKYKIVTSFLKTEEAYRLLGSVDTSIFPDNKAILEYIFKLVVDNSADATIKDAFEYYIDLTEKLGPLEFFTKKEITKNFRLTEIFTDTLDIKSLTLSQKDAFRKFFKYISQIKPDALTSFKSWDEAKTRGQFMKLLFQHLLSTADVGQEIKDSIKVLDVLVRMDGKASLPP